MNTDWMRTITSAEARGDGRVFLLWSDGTAAEVALAGVRDVPTIGDWGHSLVWPDGREMGADALWLATLDAIGRQDSRAFLEWRMAHGLSLSRAAEELGISRRTVANYSNGSQPVPKAILLACKGWSAVQTEAA
ncbi:MAG: helix-turn-helix domain-containing protein [Porphyrobacter sp.]|nr:helix-turn-helix domain-containing protein [Porphyrobacter sp.]